MSKKPKQEVADCEDEQPKKKRRLVSKSATQIREKKIERYEMDGRWADYFGRPGVKSLFICQSEAKSGKSTLFTQFAQYVSQFGRVCYVSAEERLDSDTLQDRMERLNVVEPNVRWYDTHDIEALDKLISTGGFRFAIIDSLTVFNIGYDRFVELYEKYRKRKLFWILIFQAGDNITRYKHLATAVMEMKNYQLSIISRSKSGKTNTNLFARQQTALSF